jgi:hypothetical protein
MAWRSMIVCMNDSQNESGTFFLAAFAYTDLRLIVYDETSTLVSLSADRLDRHRQLIEATVSGPE